MEYQERDLAPHPPPPPCTHVHQRQMMWKGELLGDIFYVKQFLDARPKILNEFNRQIDPELKFYYWTGGNKRYRDFKMPSFNQPCGEGLLRDWKPISKT